MAHAIDLSGEDQRRPLVRVAEVNAPGVAHRYGGRLVVRGQIDFHYIRCRGEAGFHDERHHTALPRVGSAASKANSDRLAHSGGEAAETGGAAERDLEDRLPHGVREILTWEGREDHVRTSCVCWWRCTSAGARIRHPHPHPGR
jgi:hypothetical protein